jgi:hypothetical protein
MTIHSNFRPQFGSTQNVAPAAASASVVIGSGNRTIRVKNTGATNVGYFRVGYSVNGAVTATAADMPVYPGETVYVDKDPMWDTVAYISASGTTFAITAGDGGMGSGN